MEKLATFFVEIYLGELFCIINNYNLGQGSYFAISKNRFFFRGAILPSRGAILRGGYFVIQGSYFAAQNLTVQTVVYEPPLRVLANALKCPENGLHYTNTLGRQTKA